MDSEPTSSEPSQLDKEIASLRKQGLQLDAPSHSSFIFNQDHSHISSGLFTQSPPNPVLDDSILGVNIASHPLLILARRCPSAGFLRNRIVQAEQPLNPATSPHAAMHLPNIRSSNLLQGPRP